ncbi:uncharacterized protein [Nicotiana sylvestris]|uniref:uncharacterized protein n=1 Tax=Nicotiana sylvestris TaxID=4096 RepID=UPI00388CDB0B
MSFGLKNAGATYMRAMTTIFYDMRHNDIEVYVDDVIIKSKKATDHIDDLGKFFNRLWRYNLKLNPVKCAFGVPDKKLLGFIVSRRRIELDPSKVKDIQELPPPKNKNDVMCFLGRLNYISRFIAQSIVICEPIFKLLKKNAATKWTDDCQKAFDRIKEYLSTPPVLVLPDPGRSLLLYLAVLDGALGCELRKRFRKTEFQHVPRVQNEFVDALVTLTSMIQHPDKNFIDPIPVKIHDQPAYCVHIEEEVDGKPWFHEIKEYLARGDDLMKAMCETFKIRYKNFTAYRPQMNGVVEAANKNIKKILRKMTEKHKQWHEKLSFALPGYCTTVDTSTGATPYMLVYITEVVIPVEVEIPSLRIIHEAELDDADDLMKAMCETFKIRYKNFTAYRPQMNGVVEAANKNIKKILRKMTEKHKQWHEKLSFALSGYCTTVDTPTGATPYMLVYITEVVIPVEVEIPSLRIIQEAELDDAE